MSSPSFSVHQLVHPTATDLDNVIDALAAAFEDDEFVAIITGRDHSLVRPFVRSYVIAGSLAGDIYVAENSEKVVIGAAVWFGPGRDVFDSEDQQVAGLLPLKSQYTPDVRKWWSEEFLPAYRALTISAFGPGTMTAAWHLEMIGVVPRYQRQGIAKALVQKVQEKAAGQVLCLETENESNVCVYERLGFQSKGSTIVSSAHGNFRMWALIQEMTNA